MIPRPEIDFQRTPVTLIVAGVVVAMELAAQIRPELRILYADNLKLGMLSPVWSGEIWRPVTSTLPHANLFHAAFNVYWLVIFGSVLERHFGWARYLGLLVLLAYVSMMPDFLLSNLDTPLNKQVAGTGFSGVGYGLFGLLWVGRRWRPEFHDACNDDTVRLLIFWFFFCIVLTHLEIMPVANVAHGAGWAFGSLYGMALFSRRRRRVWLAAAVVASLLVLATVIAAPGHPLYERHRINEQRRAIWRQIQRNPPVETSDR